MTTPAQTESARIRGYLQQQGSTKTSEDLISRIQEAVEELTEAAMALDPAKLDILCPSEESPGEEWTPRQCFAHIVGGNMAGAQRILHVAHGAEPPDGPAPSVPDAIPEALAKHAESMESLYEHVRAADPEGNLDVLWQHPTFGDLNWREWFLFLRIHCKDHARQLQAMDAQL
jgi:hypothetical protein